MNWEVQIRKSLEEAFERAFSKSFDFSQIPLTTPPKPEQGDIALGCFLLSKQTQLSPKEVAKKLAPQIHSSWVEKAEATGPYVNLFLKRHQWAKAILSSIQTGDFFQIPSEKRERILLEYSSPNTNKPLHLGHVRNGVLGMSYAKLLEALGQEVILVNLINDRGIHIAKSMVAYQKWGEGKTPKEVGKKGDHFVGDFYVLFETKLKEEKEAFFKEKGLSYTQPKLSKQEWGELLLEKGWISKEELEKAMASQAPLDKALLEMGVIDKRKRKEILKLKAEEEKKRKEELEKWENQFLEKSPLMKEAREVLKKWEEGDPEVRALWQKMNEWVYEGFHKTYQRLGFFFHHWDYESETYLLGKKLVQKYWDKGVFYRKEDGSVWAKLKGSRGGIPLKDKLILRKDGTSVYITQDLGTAVMRYEKWKPDKMVYVVASEQNLHFATLFEILEKLGFRWAKKCYHASYGMVILPAGRGKLKSREGTAVDADTLLDDLEKRAKAKIKEGGYFETEEDIEKNAHSIALGALKFFLLKVSPTKDVVFDPDQAIQFQGDTGPYIQYSHARICSIWRKAPLELKTSSLVFPEEIEDLEWELLLKILHYPKVVAKSAQEWNPSHLANYLLELSKSFSKFYSQCPVLQADTKEKRSFRLFLCLALRDVLAKGLEILGIPAPERM